jgi:hypothetical protein
MIHRSRFDLTLHKTAAPFFNNCLIDWGRVDSRRRLSARHVASNPASKRGHARSAVVAPPVVDRTRAFDSGVFPNSPAYQFQASVSREQNHNKIVTCLSPTKLVNFSDLKKNTVFRSKYSYRFVCTCINKSTTILRSEEEHYKQIYNYTQIWRPRFSWDHRVVCVQ